MKGGYKIIDFKNINLPKLSTTTNVNLASEGVIIKDIYKSIKSTNKIILVQNVMIENKKYRICFVNTQEEDLIYVMKVVGSTRNISIYIDKDDHVGYYPNV